MELTLSKIGVAAGSVTAIIMLMAIFGSGFVWVAEADGYHADQEKLAAQVVAIADLVQILGTKESMRGLKEEQLVLLQAKAQAAQEAEARAAVTKKEAEEAVIDRLCASGVLSGAHCS